MKKTVLVLLLILTFTVVHAQTIVIESPGILTDLSTAIIGVPAAAVTGIVSGIVDFELRGLRELGIKATTGYPRR